MILSKPLGVGVITTALKREQAAESHVAAAVDSMKRLNKAAGAAAQTAAASAVTDITGFGLLGHAREMAAQAGADFHFQLDRLPFLDGAVHYAEQGAFPGGMGNNMRFFQEYVRFGPQVSRLMQDLVYTPETSGGLLVAVHPQRVPDYLAACDPAWIVGEVRAGSGLVHVA